MNGEPKPVDTNTYIECRVCWGGYPWKDYWKPRYVEPENVDPRIAFVCDECIEHAKREHHIHKMETQHHQLGEFAQ